MAHSLQPLSVVPLTVQDSLTRPRTEAMLFASSDFTVKIAKRTFDQPSGFLLLFATSSSHFLALNLIFFFSERIEQSEYAEFHLSNLS
jgi:hypothetical protein